MTESRAGAVLAAIWVCLALVCLNLTWEDAPILRTVTLLAFLALAVETLLLLER